MIRMLRKYSWLLAVVVLAVAAAGWAARDALKERYHQIRAHTYKASAERFLAEGDTSSAQIQARQAIQHAPFQGETWALMGRILEKDGAPETAPVYARAWELSTNVANRGEIAAGFLEACVASGQAAMADALAPSMLEKHGGSAAVWRAVGDVRALQQKPAEALEAYRKAKELAPGDERIEFNEAIATLAAGEPGARAAAISTLEEKIEDGEFGKRAASALADYWSRTDPPKAVEILDRALAKQPGWFDGRVRRILALHKAKGSQTVGTLEALLDEAGESGQRRQLALAALVIGGPDAAEQIYLKMPASDFEEPPILLDRFGVWARQGAWDKIIKAGADHKPVGNNQDGQFDVLLWVVRAQLARTDAANARMTIRNLETVVDGKPLLAYRAGNILAGFGLLRESLPFFQRAGEMPGMPGNLALLRLADAAAASGQMTAAVEANENLLKRAPTNPIFKNNVAALLLGTGAELDRATSLAAEAHAAMPAAAPFAATYALALARGGKADEGLDALDRATGAGTNDMGFVATLAHCQWAAGQTNAAVETAARVDRSKLLPSQGALLNGIPAPTAAAAGTPAVP